MANKVYVYQCIKFNCRYVLLKGGSVHSQLPCPMCKSTMYRRGEQEIDEKGNMLYKGQSLD